MLRPNRRHTLLARDPCKQLKYDFVLDEPPHYCINVQLKIIWVHSSREEVGNPVLDLLYNGSIMRPELVLGELVFMDRLYPMVVEVEGVLLWVGSYHPVLELPPFYGLIQASEQPVLLQLGLLGEEVLAFL